MRMPDEKTLSALSQIVASPAGKTMMAWLCQIRDEAKDTAIDSPSGGPRDEACGNAQALRDLVTVIETANTTLQAFTQGKRRQKEF